MDALARRMDRHRRRTVRDVFRLSAIQVFLGGFLLLLGSATALGIGQYNTSHRAPYVSMGMSVAAVACTVAALIRDRRRRSQS